MSAYAELAVTTNFSFLRGASHPGEMVARADELKLAAIGIADRNSFAGVVRAYDEWEKRKSIKLVVGTRLVTIDGFEVLTYPTDRQAYGRLCRLLTKANLKAKKGECHLTFEDILDSSDGQIFIALPPLTLFVDRHPEVPAEGGPRRMTGQSISGFAEIEIVSNSRSAESRPGCRRPSRLASLAPQGGGNEFTARLAALVRAAPNRTFLARIHYHRGDEPRPLR